MTSTPTAAGDTRRAVSQENVDLIRAVYARWGVGDLWTPEIFDPGVEVVWAAEIPGASTYHGLAGAEETVRQWVSAWAAVRIELEELIDLGERALALITVYGRGKDSGVETEGRYAHVWTMRDGKATRFEGYSDWADARTAVGLGD
jgi:hypothetical protein